MPKNIAILITLALTIVACGAPPNPTIPSRSTMPPAPTSILNGEYVATPASATITPYPSATAPAPATLKDMRYYGESWYSEDNPVEPGRVYYQATASETRIRMFVEADSEHVIRDNHHSGLGPLFAILSFYCLKDKAHAGISTTMLARAAFEEGGLRVRIITDAFDAKERWAYGGAEAFEIGTTAHPEAYVRLSASTLYGGIHNGTVYRTLATTHELTFELGDGLFSGGGPFTFDAKLLRESPAWPNITECEE